MLLPQYQSDTFETLHLKSLILKNLSMQNMTLEEFHILVLEYFFLDTLLHILYYSQYILLIHVSIADLCHISGLVSSQP